MLMACEPVPPIEDSAFPNEDAAAVAAGLLAAGQGADVAGAVADHLVAEDVDQWPLPLSIAATTSLLTVIPRLPI